MTVTFSEENGCSKMLHMDFVCVFVCGFFNIFFPSKIFFKTDNASVP